ncbi:MAG: phosphogluconate dehydrogenase (NAD(+)-dependent, decarboxylating) [Bryobacteraceae bacterium]
MQIGMVGLGRMGANMARRLMAGGHHCVVYDQATERVLELAAEGAKDASSLDHLVRELDAPRAIWVMLPSGKITDDVFTQLGNLLAAGDIMIDGGNTHYVDDVRHAQQLGQRGVEFVDCGTSGGVWGVERGYCLMIGAKKEVYEHLEPIFRTLAPGPGNIERTPDRDGLNPTAEFGYLYCGPAGAGHFVKMVHNGIEYGLMQAYGEGFDIMRNAHELGYDLPLPDIAEVWRRGSVVSSWLLDLTARAMARSHDLEEFQGYVEDSGEGRWTIEAAIQTAVPCQVLTAALYTRFRSRLEHSFGEKMLSAMRSGFGGHKEAATKEASV